MCPTWPNESYAGELVWISGVETSDQDGKLNIDRVSSSTPAWSSLELVLRWQVRAAVTALRHRFAAVGNNKVEVLVTLGSDGSMYFDNSGNEVSVGCYSLGTPNGKPRDTTGAGDCYRGSFVAARYGLNMDLTKAMTWASAAGSLAVEVPGAMPSMPSKVQIERRIEEDATVQDILRRSNHI